MSHLRNGAMPKAVSPTGARRVLILGYYDGATDGVLEADTGDVYRFDLIDEVHNPEGCDFRTFALRPLAVGSLDRLTEIIGPHIPPTWPVWVPVWRFPSDSVRQDVEQRLDAILAEAGEIEWEVRSGDSGTLAHFTFAPTTRAAVH
jgi:hypothetical protein